MPTSFYIHYWRKSHWNFIEWSIQRTIVSLPGNLSFASPMASMCLVFTANPPYLSYGLDEVFYGSSVAFYGKLLICGFLDMVFMAYPFKLSMRIWPCTGPFALYGPLIMSFMDFWTVVHCSSISFSWQSCFYCIGFVFSFFPFFFLFLLHVCHVGKKEYRDI